jgi:spore maturation protein A
MLNYVWLALIAIGIIVAVGSDVRDQINNPYRNGVPIETVFEVEKAQTAIRPTWEGTLVFSAAAFNQFYSIQSAKNDIRQPVVVTENSITVPISDSSPQFWKEMAKAGGTKEKMAGKVQSITFSEDKSNARIVFVLEKVAYVKVRAVTKAALDYADTAVTLALGLIGIMAMWLGVMKVAEEAGLLKVLTKALTPLTRKLFPDIPPDHPAVGSMIMNIAANMLGLSNAATPLGLKAMEELNKLNPKAGTATDAMCTFLVINTGGITLIPATAIALRAAAGSADPSIIIGTSVFGASCATIAGLIAVKLLQRLPGYKKALLPEKSGEVSNG